MLCEVIMQNVVEQLLQAVVPSVSYANHMLVAKRILIRENFEQNNPPISQVQCFPVWKKLDEGVVVYGT
jgi:hypothetical protein